MPLATKAEQSAYQTEWMKQRREAWIDAHGPCANCGGENDLVIAYPNPAKHSLWSLKDSKRKAELSKATVLCRECFNESRAQHGTRGRYDKGCRCDLCRAAKSGYQKTLRAKLRHISRHSAKGRRE